MKIFFILTAATVLVVNNFAFATDSFDEQLSFDNNQLPAGWSFGFIEGTNAQIVNDRFEVGQVDTIAYIEKAKTLPALANKVVISYTGNIADVVFGMNSQIEILMTNGDFLLAAMGKYGGIETNYFVIENQSAVIFEQFVPTNYGTFRANAVFENGQITYTVTQLPYTNEAPMFTQVISAPGFDLSKMSKIRLWGVTTTGQSAWIDDVSIQALFPITIVQTNRATTTNEIAPPIFHPPPTFTQLEVFTNGIFTTNVVLNPNAMTIVLTHGWIPLYPLTSLPIFVPNGVEDWPTTMAAQLHAQDVTANIVAWNWEDTAKSSLADPKRAGSQSPGEGFELGMALFNAFGPNYSKPIHFIGHSFGTLVNAYAANYLQGTNFANESVSSTPWPATNMQMTLFDEAEVGADQNFNLNSEDITLIEALVSGNGNSLNLNMPSSYYHPLPRNFAWADNYVSAFGLLHTNAANVILTDGFPTDAPDPISLLKEIGAFHGYPQTWYDETIETDISSMGFLWSFERGGWFSQAPSEGSVYVQASNNSPWNLTPTNWNYGTNFLEQRFQKYDAGLGNSTAQFVDNTITADGTAIAQVVWDITTDNPEWLVSLETTVFNSVTPQVKVHPLGLTANDEGSSTNVPAYAWMQLIVPTNAVSMSFNYIIQGDWKSDSLAAAFKGTNVLLIAGNTIQTNVTFSSGSIDVSSFAGQTNEFFVGIVGGTSTNAQLTVENLAFSISSPPLLQAQSSGNNFVLTWPLSAADYTLESSADLISWTTNTDVSTIVNLQNTITNSISGGARFYRLKK